MYRRNSSCHQYSEPTQTSQFKYNTDFNKIY